MDACSTVWSNAAGVHQLNPVFALQFGLKEFHRGLLDNNDTALAGYCNAGSRCNR